MWKSQKTSRTQLRAFTEFRSTWDSPTADEQRLCMVSARALLPFANEAFVDAVTDGKGVAETRFLEAIEPFILMNHDRSKSDGKRRQKPEPQVLDLPLDLSDPKQVDIFLLAATVAIGARLFSVDYSEPIFDMDDCGLAVILRLSESQLSAVKAATVDAGLNFDSSFKRFKFNDE